MHDNQYCLFQDLDRRCVSRGFQGEDCQESVRLKRASIDLENARGNPVVSDVLASRTTFVETYDAFSRGFRGVRRFLPQPHNAAQNERLRHLAKIVPNVRHFTRRSFFALDNPITAAVYGVLVAVVMLRVWTASMQVEDDGMEGAPAIADSTGRWIIIVFGAIGLLAGTLAMLRYRTRDPKDIHAREAAAYMDVNYEFYKLKNDRAWAELIRQQGGTGASRIALARPER